MQKAIWHNPRVLSVAGFLACAGLLAYAYILQFIDDLEPCPLCIFQRIAFIAVGMLFLASAIFGPGPTRSRWYAWLIAIASSIGGIIAARHIYIQGLPADEVPSCGPGLEYMLETLPIAQTLKEVFTGSGECAEISWTFLGLSIPWWALLWFVGLAAWGFFANRKSVVA
jgi:disulfide bond formation protein DsbB